MAVGLPDAGGWLGLAGPIAPMLLVDVLNPVLFAMLVFTAGARRPVISSTALLAGHTVAYYVAGIIIALGIERIGARLAAPHRIDFVLSGIVGLGLLALALTTRKSGAPDAEKPAGELTPARCFGLGAIVNFIGIPFALPYFAVVDRIIKAPLNAAEALTALGVYNIVYAAPFLVVPVAVAVAGDGARPLLGRINAMIGRASDILMPWMFLLLGAALCADSAAYFLRGEGLWEFGQASAPGSGISGLAPARD
jgi:cytochrome c biogenesis protein CcdA